jgi:hypothetical protein
MMAAADGVLADELAPAATVLDAAEVERMAKERAAQEVFTGMPNLLGF